MNSANKMKRLFCRILALCFLFSFAITAQADSVKVYRNIPNDEKKIAITFDDGPHPTQTKEILDILDCYHAKATFFMIGKNVKNYPEVAKEVLNRGNEIGNHTYSHFHLLQISSYELQKEFDKCEDALEELCEYRPHLLRPPEGVVNQSVKHCSEDGEYRIILWRIDTRDWECKNANEIADKVLSQVRSGDIILMHDYVDKSKTPEALEMLLPKLLAQGYQPVTVSELLGIR